MDEIEQFVVNVASIGLFGECLTHEDDCGLLREDCIEVERDPQDEHELLAHLIIEAREILQRSNQ